MSKSMRTRLRVLMALARVDDQWRHDTTSAITELAPTSPLFAIPEIQASVAKIATLAASLKAHNETMNTGRAKLASDAEKEAKARSILDGQLLTLKSLVDNNATDVADITSMGLEERGARRTRGQLTAPEAIDIRSTKVRGQFTASAREVGNTRWQYAAEWSSDPVGDGTWTTLPGSAKSRKVTGPSGSKVWVRFARLSGQAQSDWSTPVLVTIP